MKNYLTNRSNGLGFNFFDDIFDDFFKPVFYGGHSHGMKTDIKKKENGYELSVDMPGFDKKDINIECKDGYLTVSVKKEEKQESDNKNYIRKERFYGEYTRTFYLGELDTDKIEAKFNNGTLHITVPKEEKQVNKRVIEISG